MVRKIVKSRYGDEGRKRNAGGQMFRLQEMPDCFKEEYHEVILQK
jgi:hypothetical protein